MKTLQSLLVGLALVAACSSASIAAPTGPVADSSSILTPWRFSPELPCFQDSVYMVVRGFVATPCDSFAGAEAIDSAHVRIRVQVYDDRRCLAAPSIFYQVPIGLGRFAPGQHMGLVDFETTHVRGDGTSYREVQQLRFVLGVSSDCPIPQPPPPPTPLPFVDAIFTAPLHPCAGQPTAIVLQGHFFDGCGQLTAVNLHDASNLEFDLQIHRPEDHDCTLGLKPWSLPVNLGPLPSGPHRTNITVHVFDFDPRGDRLTRSTPARTSSSSPATAIRSRRRRLRCPAHCPTFRTSGSGIPATHRRSARKTASR